MNYGKLLSIGVIVLAVGACIGYALVHDWRRATYWAASAVLVSSMTF